MTRRKKASLLATLLIVLGCLFFLLSWMTRSRKVTLHLGIHEGSSWDVPQGQDNRVLDDIIKRFEKAHPGVMVVYESGIRKSDYSSWLSDKLVKGDQPDIFMVPENDFNLLASLGSLKNLDRLGKKDIKASDFYTVSYQAGHYRGSQYALPFESNPIMMCINKDLLKKSGFKVPEANWTISDFYKIARAATKDTDSDGQLDQFGIVGYNWKNAMAAYGNQMFSEDGSQLHLNTNKTKSAMTLMMNLDALSGTQEVTSQDFDQGKVVFRPMTMAEYRTYKPYPYHIAKYSTFEWTCVPMPSADRALQSTQVESSLFAMSSQTKHTDLAWELLKMLTYDEHSQQELVKQSQGISVLRSVMASEDTADILQKDNFGSDSLKVSTVNHMMMDGFNHPKFKRFNTVYEEADYLLTKSLSEGTVDTDLALIEKKLSQSLR